VTKSTHRQCHPRRETMSGLRCQATGVRIHVSNDHLSCRLFSGFRTWGSPYLGRSGCRNQRRPQTFFHFPSSRLAFRRLPRVSIKTEGNWYEFLLDTGAELSVITSSLLSSLPLDFSRHSPHINSVQGFAGKDVIKRPYSLPVEVCGVKFIHPFYTWDSPTPCVADNDLVCAAELVIYPVRHMV